MRAFDFLIALISLFLLSFILLIIIVILRFTGEGEIFFTQNRVGRNMKNFKVIKFATMLKNSPNIGAGTITEKNDFRILPVGGFLRKTKLNELPQLVNILKGEMSLIGPRPQTSRDLLGVEKTIIEKALSIRPGLSGISSIIFRNEEKLLHSVQEPREFYDTQIAPYKANLNVWYVENKSFLLYFFLIFLTFLVVLGINSSISYKLLKNLPRPTGQLKDLMDIQ